MHATTEAEPVLHFRSADQAIKGPIQYAFTNTELGLALVGRSADGVCCALLGDSESDLFLQLQALFAQTEYVFAGNGLSQELAQIRTAIHRGVAPTGLRLDVGGTPFQQRVWQALCAIPAGQTRSYKDIAKQIAKPNATRAVASACAANVIAIALPCHRVVRSDGSLSGYRWGIERKRSLLRKEQSA